MQGRAARLRRALCHAALAASLFAWPAAASEVEIVTAHFSDLPEGVPVFVFDRGMTEDDEAVAKRIAGRLRGEGLKVLEREPRADEAVLLLTFDLDRFVPERPDDRSGFGVEIKGASGSGVSARLIVPKLRKRMALQPEAPQPPPGPVLTLDMRVDLGSARRVWLGRATAPLGDSPVLKLELDMAEGLVDALMSAPGG